MHLLSKFLVGAALYLSSQALVAQTLYAGYLNTIQNTLQYDGKHFTGTLSPLVNCINLKSALDMQPLPAAIDSLIQGLSDGSIEIVIGLVADDARDAVATASKPILRLPAMLISREAFDPKQLSDVLVSTARGSAYAHALKRADAIIQYADSYNGALEQFFNGDVEAAVIPKASMSMSADMIDDNLFVAPFSEDRIVYYVSNRSPQADAYLEAIGNGINNCMVQTKR
jgi:ABC-type amino acid transport substrate-binding protein